MTTRRLSRDEAMTLAEDIRHTPGITGYRPDELRKLPDVLVLEDQGQLGGILAYIETAHFIDLKLFIVRPPFRGQGCGKLLFDRFSDHFAGTHKPIYLVTKNPAVIHLVEAAGYRRVHVLRLPVLCIIHQAKMIGSWYRIREYVRKRIAFARSGRFSYWLKRSE